MHDLWVRSLLLSDMAGAEAGYPAVEHRQAFEVGAFTDLLKSTQCMPVPLMSVSDPLSGLSLSGPHGAACTQELAVRDLPRRRGLGT